MVKYISKYDQEIFGFKIPKGTQFYHKKKTDPEMGVSDKDGNTLAWFSKIHSSLVLSRPQLFDEVTDKVVIKEMNNTTEGIEIKCNYAFHYKTKEAVRKRIEEVLNQESLYKFNFDNQVELLQEDIESVHLFLDKLGVARCADNGEKYSINGRIKVLINYRLP